MLKENYFKVNNGALTNSKIKDYLLCPNFFYRKHILGTVKDDCKYHFAVGGAVDDILTQITSKDKYICVSRRNLKNPPTDYIELNKTQYEEIMGLAGAVEETEAWQELQQFPQGFQNIIEMPIMQPAANKHFDRLAGIPDHYYIENNICYITDLKTTQTVSDQKYYYHCLEYGYHRQLAMYRKILATNYPLVKQFVCRHIAVEKIKDVYRVKTFVFADNWIDAAEAELNEAINRVLADTEFKKFNPDWKTAVKLGNPEF